MDEHMRESLALVVARSITSRDAGASKILFAVLPEIVLPVDNKQWLDVFRTVDLGDVINCMVCDIQEWESATHSKLNEMDKQRRLTTLPSVYNVMAMGARAG